MCTHQFRNHCPARCYTSSQIVCVSTAQIQSLSRHRPMFKSFMHMTLISDVQTAAHRLGTADVFESFVGGLYRDQGLEAVKAWLHPLLIPYLSEAYTIVRRQHGLPATPSLAPPAPWRSLSSQSSSSQSSTNGPPDTPPGSVGPESAAVSVSPSPVSFSAAEDGADAGSAPIGHLALFNQHIQKTNREIEWVYSDGDGFGFDGFTGDEKNPAAERTGNAPEGGNSTRRGTKTTPVWMVTALVGGEDFGNGMGTSKKAARNEAAKKGLVKLGIVVWRTPIRPSELIATPLIGEYLHVLPKGKQ
ncbi:hypothetical protein HGRIS_010140 [Hohenbuehelia grisea]|uniref:DRBM domain-containing protein n=1 Tax=Hohenbuehelia grisea TaxID=104357 RepID=A0ABR3J3D9_9AGAR